MSTGLPRATSTLQEVGLLLLWLFSTLRVVWLCLAPGGGGGGGGGWGGGGGGGGVWLHFDL